MTAPHLSRRDFIRLTGAGGVGLYVLGQTGLLRGLRPIGRDGSRIHSLQEPT